MKFKKISATILISCALLAACNNDTSQVAASNASEISSEKSTLSETTVTESSDEKFIQVPDEDGLKKALASPLSDIGVSDVKNLAISSIDKLGNDIDAKVSIETEQKKLTAHCSYISVLNDWTVILIEGPDGHYYYVPEELENNFDLYDYSTDKLISSQSETFGDPLEEYNSELESIDESFDSALDSIADEYNIKR